MTVYSTLSLEMRDFSRPEGTMGKSQKQRGQLIFPGQCAPTVSQKFVGSPSTCDHNWLTTQASEIECQGCNMIPS
jgi:hypothetical protein